MDRRTFVGVAAAGWLAACASLVATEVAPENGRIRLFLRNHPGLDRPGGALKVRPTGTELLIYVLALGGGAFAALSPICKHLGCTVNVDGDRLVCPCHGSTYGRDGRLLRGPAEAPLDHYPVEAADGVLTITLDLVVA